MQRPKKAPKVAGREEIPYGRWFPVSRTFKFNGVKLQARQRHGGLELRAVP